MAEFFSKLERAQVPPTQLEGEQEADDEVVTDGDRPVSYPILSLFRVFFGFHFRQESIGM
ncbi:hypothetical protein D3C87_1884400 [compost metagenome]